MPPNNPMTEGEALAVEAIAVDLEHFANCPARVLLLAGKLRALTAHTAASGGEVVAWLAADDTGRVIDAKAKAAGSRASATGSATAIYNIPLYTTPPFAVPADALERLVEKWQRDSVNERDYYADALRDCADELAALIPKGADHGQR